MQVEVCQRDLGLGNLSVLPDPLINIVLGWLDVPSILALASTSKVLRIFALEEPLWQYETLKYRRGLLVYHVRGSNKRS
jgi:F-box domain